MISFRKFVMVGAMLAAFAGLASAAVGDPSVNGLTLLPGTYPTLRAEGLTEAIPDLTFTVSTDGPITAALGAKATYDITLLATSGAPFTSDVNKLTVGGVVNAGNALNIASNGGIIRIPGVVLNFALGSSSASVTVKGLRLDANAIGPNSFVALQATVFPTTATPGVNVNSTPETVTNVTVATILTSLKTTITGASADKPVTGSTTSGPAIAPAWTSKDFDPTEADGGFKGTPLFNATFTPQFAGAFVTGAGEAALRFTFSLTNIPAGLALYVPQSKSGLTMIIGADANGKGGYSAPDTVDFYAVPGNGMVTYEAGAAFGAAAFSIPVYSVGTTPVALTSSAAPFTFNGSYAPVSSDISASSSAPVLRFAKTSVTEIDSFVTVTLPSSTFAFPYVVNGSGWVTGIAVINGGAGWGSAADVKKGAAGTCKLTFYSADGSVAAPAAATVPLAGAAIAAIPAGGNYGFTLDQVPGVGSYAGIVYGTCNFDNAKAFGYLNGGGTTAAYLAQ